MWIHVTTRTSSRYLHFWGVLSLMLMLRTNSALAQSAVYYSDISDDGVNVYAWAVTDAYMGTSIYHHSVQTAGAMQSEVNFEYDADGNLIGRESFIAGISRGKSRYTYNAQGDMITAEENDAAPVQFEYTYDSFGNWIRQTVHHAGGSDESHRIITYYKD